MEKIYKYVNLLQDDKILDWSKLKQLHTTILNLMKIAESSLNRLENTVGKGEIAHYEQFLLLQQCFQKACFPGASKGVIVWE